ncbi:MAG: serine hydrolase domain-containing protein [Rhodothermales bacterium]
MIARRARYRWKSILVIALLIGGSDATLAFAQEAPVLSYGEPAEVGLSPAVLAGALGMYEEAVERGDLVGAVVLVARNGRVVLHEAIGMSDKEAGRAMQRNTMFHMASNTKPVVAAAIAQQVEAEQLAYSDLVREYIPEWDNYRAGFITIGQMLSHTSGFRINSLFLPPSSANTSLQQAAARFGEVGAKVTPGTSYSYSNPGYNTLGALLEMQSGQLLEAHLDDAIYTLLGMDDSYNYQADHPLEGKRDRLGPMYYQRGDDGAWMPAQATTIPFARGSGGMVSTAWDYAVFCQMILNGGTYNGTQILDPESVKLMTSPKTETPFGAYGYGWMLNDGIIFHGGSDGTDAWIDPEHGIIGLVFTQTPRGRPSIGRFRELVNLSIER